MSTGGKLLGLLTMAQAELLKLLYELEAQTKDGRFWKPRELGAYRSSHHALTLRKLCDKGLVEREDRASSFGYRIAQEGKSFWSLLVSASDVPPIACYGGAHARSQVQALTRLAA